jgi:phosphate-selective porin OprO/OprP
MSVYERGAFKWTTSLAAGDHSPEFSRFDEGVMFFSRFAWDAGPEVGLKSWITQADWFCNSRPDNSNARGREHSFALSSGLEQGRWGFVAEALYGTGYDKPDVWGGYLMPSCFLIPEKLQLVMRWQWADSASDTGLQLFPRYEALAPGLLDSGARGHDYQALYLGLNWYLLQHQLKLMTGAEYHHMEGPAPGDDFDGWTLLTGMRAYF